MNESPTPDPDERPRLRRRLAAYAPTIYFLNRQIGSRQTADYITEKMGTRIPRKAILSIVNKVRRGEIRLNPEDFPQN